MVAVLCWWPRFPVVLADNSDLQIPALPIDFQHHGAHLGGYAGGRLVPDAPTLRPADILCSAALPGRLAGWTLGLFAHKVQALRCWM